MNIVSLLEEKILYKTSTFSFNQKFVLIYGRANLFDKKVNQNIFIVFKLKINSAPYIPLNKKASAIEDSS